MKKENKILMGILVITLLTGCIERSPPVSDEKSNCEKDSDCVSEQCCHPTSCVNKNFAPNCKGVFCTEECKKGSMDCGCGHCSCISGKCQVTWTREESWC